MSVANKRTRRFSLAVMVGLLLAVGFGMAFQRHYAYDVPWLPGAEQVVWSIEATVEFTATGAPVSVSLRRPMSQKGFAVMEESGASPGFGLAFVDDNGLPAAQWSKREVSGRQRLYYRVDVLERPSGGDFVEVAPPALRQVSWEEPYNTAVTSVLDQAYSLSSDPFSMARQLIARFQSGDRAQNEQLIMDGVGKNRLPELLADMLQSRNIPAAAVFGLQLEDGRRRQQLVPMLRVWSGEDSQVFWMAGDRRDRSLPMLLWQPTRGYVLEVSGGRNSNLSFAMLRSGQTDYGRISSALGEARDWLGFSIYALPIEEQAMFKTILLLPVGALVVCILRILVGLKTSGTFMPILIALAFIETTLLTGLIGFLLVVSAGLMIRSYMSHLNLLLVARISTVIITVITIIALFSVFSFQVGLTEGLKITFFPLIIMSWTVERMSILWEEEGAREVAIQGGGSLLTAVIAFFAMTNPWVQHLSFNFISLQFVVLALIMILGNYNGYRLLELRRFSALLPKRTET